MVGQKPRHNKVEAVFINLFSACSIAYYLAARNAFCLIVWSSKKMGRNMEISVPRQKVVLVIDDNKMIQQIHTLFLGTQNYGVVVAGSGEEAITILKANCFIDAILLDINLPGVDGYEVSRIIRHDLKNKHIPIIGITTNSASEIREKCSHAGMNDVYTKPIDLETLEKVLKKFV